MVVGQTLYLLSQSLYVLSTLDKAETRCEPLTHSLPHSFTHSHILPHTPPPTHIHLANNASCVLVPYQYPQCCWRNIGSSSSSSSLLKPSLFEKAFISVTVSVTARGVKVRLGPFTTWRGGGPGTRVNVAARCSPTHNKVLLQRLGSQSRTIRTDNNSPAICGLNLSNEGLPCPGPEFAIFSRHALPYTANVT